jgi:excisionase family DNA binding protein
MHPGDPHPVLLTLRGAAALLGLHPNTIRYQVRRGIIPGTKVGRSWRFLEADLVAWIREGYPEAARVQLSALEREAIWHSTDVQASITSNSQARTEASLDALLEPRTAARRRNITTG